MGDGDYARAVAEFKSLHPDESNCISLQAFNDGMNQSMNDDVE